MSIHEVRCVVQGKTYFGTYEVHRLGEIETVTVRYNGDETENETCGLPPPVVASTLLGELVSWRARPAVHRRTQAADHAPGP